MKNKERLQGKEQIDALKTLKPNELEAIRNNRSEDDGESLKYKEIFHELSHKTMSQIYNIDKKKLILII